MQMLYSWMHADVMHVAISAVSISSGIAMWQNCVSAWIEVLDSLGRFFVSRRIEGALGGALRQAWVVGLGGALRKAWVVRS